MSHSKKSLLFSFLTLMLSVIAIPGFSQSVWTPETNYESKAGMEIQIPSFDFLEADFPTSVIYLYTHWALNDKYTLKVELPISHFSSDNFLGFGGNISETALGNPYLGINISSPQSNVGVDIGVRLPLAGDNGGTFTGLLSENHDFTPFIPETFAFVADVDYSYKNSSGLIINVGGGPQVIAPDDFSDAELLLKYYTQILYGANNVTFGGGVTGQAIVTEGEFSFADSSIHGLGVLGSYDFGNITLGSSLKFPLDDDLNDIVNFVFGLNVTFSI